MIVTHVFDKDIADGLQPGGPVKRSRRDTDGIGAISLPEQAASAAVAKSPACFTGGLIPVQGGIIHQLKTIQATTGSRKVVAGCLLALAAETVDDITQHSHGAVANPFTKASAGPDPAVLAVLRTHGWLVNPDPGLTPPAPAACPSATRTGILVYRLAIFFEPFGAVAVVAHYHVCSHDALHHFFMERIGDG